LDGGALSSDAGSAPPPATTHVVNGALELRTPLFPLAADCIQNGGGDCADLDVDALSDAWENEVLQRFRPKLIFDQNEGMFAEGHEPVMVGRVGLVAVDPLEVHVFIPILYPRDYGACSITAHNGDSERVALHLKEEGDALVMVAAYTAAHEGAPSTQSQVRQGDELLELVYEDDGQGQATWVVFPSRDKHATYATAEQCNGAIPIPCFNEECLPDDVPDPENYERLLPVHHAGEEIAPLITDLSILGFPGEDAWVDQKFCGGLERGITCAGAVQKKLTESPF
jgi:hypothetical protein